MFVERARRRRHHACALRAVCHRVDVLGPAFDAVVWLGIVIGAKVVLLDQGRRFLALPPGQVNVRMWRRRFIIVELLNGVALAGFALVGLGKNLGVGADLAFSSHVFSSPP